MLRQRKNRYIQLFLLLFVGFISSSKSLQAEDLPETFLYSLSVEDFIQSFIEISTSDVPDGSTLSSRYLAGRAPLYNGDNQEVGTCSASFLCMQNDKGIYTDISNYLSVAGGLIVTWFTPSKLINLEFDSIVNSMVTECLVTASTKVGINPFYGQEFNLVVSSEGGRIYFRFTRVGAIF